MADIQFSIIFLNFVIMGVIVIIIIINDIQLFFIRISRTINSNL